MLKILLENRYGIQIDEEFQMGQYEASRKKGHLFLLKKVDGMEDAVLEELVMLSNHLVQNGEKFCNAFLKTKDGKSICDWKEGKYCVLMNAQSGNRKLTSIGRKLAKFHYRGRTVAFPVNKISRIGQWKQMWESRLDQMEQVWNEMLFKPQENEFEQMFLESFPYYRGIAENAIQYIVDTELDDEPTMTDNGTICHERFTSQAWGKSFLMKNPFDWVFDHCSRDLAEWTREKYFHNIKTYEPELRQFMKDYQSVVPLSSFTWRLYFARSLFPLHYINTIESHYRTNSEQEKRQLEEQLQKFLQQSDDHERFLGRFYDFAEVPVHKWKIPILEWLKK